MKQILEREESWLASYAQHTGESKGRTYPEPEHPNRTAYQRDRDRIIHCRAFRRLEYKTQVFIIHEGDHYRTRLTHTLEVTMIARSLSRALRLNEDLTEVIALAHDIGHPPFGHSGEKALQELMKEHGGFEHNLQGLRIVEELETKYPQHKGLNLTWEVREGIAKHKSTYDKPQVDIFEPDKCPSLEAQVVNVADEIAYNTHDLDDGLESGLITFDDLRTIPLWNDIFEDISQRFPHTSEEIKRYYTIRSLIDYLVKDVLETTRNNIKKYGIRTVEDVRDCPEELVRFSPEVEGMVSELREYLYTNLYNHYQVNRMNHKAYIVITELFRTYATNPRLLPATTQEKLKDYPAERVVCDYIAGMTDRFAFQEHRKLCEVWDRL